MEYYLHEEVRPIRKIVNWIVDIIVVITFAAFLVYAFGTQVRITGQSMLPLLRADDVVLMDRLSYDFGKPDRFDVVVFQREDGKPNVKRVIGLPDEVVQIKGGRVYINGEALNAKAGLDQVAIAGLAQEPVRLGAHEYFLLGDNRNSSEDSRFINMGNVTADQILGRVWLRIYPLVDIGLVRAQE